MTESDLAQFTGSEYHYRHWSRQLRYTDGIKYVATHAGAYWLIDLIASYQPQCRKDPMLRDIQFWKLTVTGSKAVIHCLRDTNDSAFHQDIEYTDFPLTEIMLYVEGGVLMLPSER